MRVTLQVYSRIRQGLRVLVTVLWEKKMETTILGYIGLMEKKMEATILGYIGFYRVNGKETGNYYIGLFVGVFQN